MIFFCDFQTLCVSKEVKLGKKENYAQSSYFCLSSVNLLRSQMVITAHLILVNFSLFQFSFSLLLESNDNQGHEDVDKEEGKDDEVHNVEDGHFYAKQWDGTLVLKGGRHGLFQNPKRQNRILN